MDSSLAALKLLCGQLKDARGTPSQNALTLGGILFQRVWIQGVLVSNDDDDRLLLDYSTSVVELSLSVDSRQRQWRKGMYVMVVGGYFIRTGDLPVIKVHKIVDLSPFPIEKRCGILKFRKLTSCSTSLSLKNSYELVNYSVLCLLDSTPKVSWRELD
ncbi:ARM repeat superfamily protein, putative isoform 1 [Hibiscus syriacus]|uniref:ARM repeat superfamily protein, putative isoform 1 n=1 Tax=Hibiscus syriacus TaxID=106335 RepID=A0A6A3BZ85_HIBSY|nr:ARM repeat superfamily protein, putative isoform 1 [Hibiscus syriacus]